MRHRKTACFGVLVLETSFCSILRPLLCFGLQMQFVTFWCCSWGHRGEQDRTEVGSKAPPAVAKGGWIRATTFEGTLQGGAWRVPPRGKKGLKPPWSPLEALLKPPWSPSQAPLKPPWSPSQAPFKPPWSPLHLEAPFKPFSSPLEAPLKPFSSPLEAPFKRATFKPPWSPSQAPLKPFSSPLEATLNGSQAPQASFKPFWSPHPAPWKSVQALPKGLFYVRTSVRQLRCPNSCVTTAV